MVGIWFLFGVVFGFVHERCSFLESLTLLYARFPQTAVIVDTFSYENGDWDQEDDQAA